MIQNNKKMKNFMITLYEHFITADDYDRKKSDIARKIVKRQSRGNVSIQNGNGDTITEEIINIRGRKADESLQRLTKLFPYNSKCKSA